MRSVRVKRWPDVYERARSLVESGQCRRAIVPLLPGTRYEYELDVNAGKVRRVIRDGWPEGVVLADLPCVVMEGEHYPTDAEVRSAIRRISKDRKP